MLSQHTQDTAENWKRGIEESPKQFHIAWMPLWMEPLWRLCEVSREGSWRLSRWSGTQGRSADQLLKNPLLVISALNFCNMLADVKVMSRMERLERENQAAAEKLQEKLSRTAALRFARS